MACLLAARHFHSALGLIGPVITSMAVLAGAFRVRRAIWLNHRYSFTTWRCVKALAMLALVGLVLKMST